MRSVSSAHRHFVEELARLLPCPAGHSCVLVGIFHREVVAPFRSGTGTYLAAIHDVDSDADLSAPRHPVLAGATVIVDGIFLLRAELRDIWDCGVFLDVPFAESVQLLRHPRAGDRPRVPRRPLTQAAGVENGQSAGYVGGTATI